MWYSKSGDGKPPHKNISEVWASVQLCSRLACACASAQSGIWSISAQNIDCEFSLEPPHRGGSTNTHNLLFEQKCEKYQIFVSENLIFW